MDHLGHDMIIFSAGWDACEHNVRIHGEDVAGYKDRMAGL